MRAEPSFLVKYLFVSHLLMALGPSGSPHLRGVCTSVCIGEKDITETLHDCESKCGCWENSHNKLD